MNPKTPKTPKTIDATQSANLIIGELLELKPSENLAIICDDTSEMEMVDALARAALARGSEYTILHQSSRPPERKNELTPVIEAALRGADAMIGITGSGGGPTYARIVKQLLEEKRLRSISMVMRDMDIFTGGGALANYKDLYEEGKRLAAIWKAGTIMHITTKAGTDISAPVAGEDVVVECGYAREPGMEAAFSDGEVSSRPVEGKAHGVIVVDGPIAVIGKPESPIRIEVEQGRVTNIAGTSPQAAQLRSIVETVPNAANIAEFGIGLNPACRRNGRFQEEKKARGLVHIAIGDNIFYGGTIESLVHMDMVLYDPTIRLDNRLLVEEGVVCFSE